MFLIATCHAVLFLDRAVACPSSPRDVNHFFFNDYGTVYNLRVRFSDIFRPVPPCRARFANAKQEALRPSIDRPPPNPFTTVGALCIHLNSESTVIPSGLSPQRDCSSPNKPHALHGLTATRYSLPLLYVIAPPTPRRIGCHGRSRFLCTASTLPVYSRNHNFQRILHP